MSRSESLCRSPVDARHDGRSASRRPRCERKILLVEDDREMRSLVERMLERDGYAVVSVGDGDQALEWLGLCLFDGSLRNVPALIISDVRLPGFSGLELLEGLRAADHDIPVLLITGFPSEETCAEAFELGAARLLAKPFDLEALRLAVENVLESRAPARSSARSERVAGWTKPRA